MSVVRLDTDSDATWQRAWVITTTAEVIAFLATYTDPLGPHRGDIIADVETSQTYLVVGDANIAQITGLAELPIDLFNDVANILPTANGGTSVDIASAALPLGSGQIIFPATENPSAGVNILDDYEEEDAFVPDLTFGGGSTGLTYAYRGFSYTKVGRQVCVCGLIVLSNKGSSTGDVAFTLPFTVSSGNQFASANGMNFDAMAATVNNAIASCIHGTNTAFIYQTAAGTTARLNDTHFTNNSVLVIQVNFFTG